MNNMKGSTPTILNFSKSPRRRREQGRNFAVKIYDWRAIQLFLLLGCVTNRFAAGCEPLEVCVDEWIKFAVENSVSV